MSKVFEVFKRFRLMVEKETDKHIKAMHFGKRGEFTLGNFMKYCEEHDIRRFLTALYLQQHNNVVKRKKPSLIWFKPCSKVRICQRSFRHNCSTMCYLCTKQMPTY
ncbi:hypothetical protein VIGAN_06103700 [Vigna angularis var. angularis]|uniref:Uncharacterized protein n=1 Tax=Vigna angularis var. angularis TaxID=157739 RepID=A0A0S3SAS6_PHAAN|nr:hypothetical protein VIGAN_06103700 [Vigna angularis var. angularis]